MRPVHLSGVDLNLLPLLNALLADPHLTRAAKAVGLSQPAASRALGRLRVLLGDPILERRGARSVLTARAETLREPVRLALGLVESALAPAGVFEPSRARRTVRASADDYAELVVLRPLVRELARLAPGIALEVSPGRGSALERLIDGDVDVAFAPLAERVPQGIRGDVLCDDGFVGMVAREHPFARRKPTLARYVAARHALIAPTGSRGSFVDRALEQLGTERQVALRVPHFLVMPFLVTSTDLVLTLSERVAQIYASLLPVSLFEPPLALPRFSTGFYCRERDLGDPALSWFRDRVLALRDVLNGSRERPSRRRMFRPA